MTTVVVYYTRFGSTAKVAQALAAELGAEVREIKAVREHGFVGMGFRSLLNLHMPIQPMNLDFSGVDRIVLCTPVWAGKPACPVRAFLRKADLKGKRLAVLFSTWGGEIDQAIRAIKADVVRQGAEVGPVDKVVTKGLSDAQLREAGRGFAQKLAP
ncbi:hypothetical protein H5T53_06885 [Candidatus Bipolaricaulota bacterium]|nr:hypothetical protein [Candidatus Bipolaricaulota bacterium]